MRPSAFDPAVQTLTELIERRGVLNAAERAVVLVDGKERDWPLSYGEIYDRARRVGAALEARGLAPGERVMIMLPSGSSFIASFFGAVLAGGVPVPLYPPFFLTEIEDFLARYHPIAADCDPTFLITFKDVSVLAASAAKVVPGLRGVLVPDELDADPRDFTNHRAQPEDTCFLQYTSGSTGTPKGVEISHRNILENVFGIGLMVDRQPEDVTVSWLPLYHDMGLIGGLLCSFFWGVPLVLLSPQQFVKYPVRWLRAISRFRGTLSPAPNFAYRICLGIPEELLEGLDISSWRVAFNGAEPVDLETIEQFCTKFEPYGFRPTTPFPVYGAAEATLAITHPRPGAPPFVEYVDREGLIAAQAEARLCRPGDPSAIACVSVGQPLPFTELAITDDRGLPLAERRVGEVRVRGPAVMKGYHNNPEASRAALEEGWLLTGDLGYLAGDHLFITGRRKDLIIKNGKNYYPQDFEEPARRVEGVRRSGVVAFGHRDPSTGTEQIVLLAETRLVDPDAKQRLRRSILEAVTRRTGVAPCVVELCPTRSILKTSSGKVRRNDVRELWRKGELGVSRPARRKLILATTAMRSLFELTRLRSEDRAQSLIRSVLGALGIS